MLSAFALALRQLADRSVLAVLVKSIAVTLVVFALLGTASWWGLDAALARAGVDDSNFDAAEGLRGLAALLGVLLGGWLLWRIIAIAVLQMFADEVVVAVEERYYPDRHATARVLGWRAELGNALRGAGRALGYNLLALPLALVLLITGVGPALLFWAVNAVLLGRELAEMVWARHRTDASAPLPLGWGQRLALGGLIAGLMFVPIVNFLAPLLGAAMAAHLVHRKTGDSAHAP